MPGPMIAFLDFEASSLLPGGFPVEVAWIDQDGRAEAYLIRPHEDWLDEAAGHPGWDPRSAAVHGISLETLLAEGTPADQIARHVAEALGRPDVTPCSDNPGFDGGWLETLLDVENFRGPSKLVDVRHVYGRTCHPLRDLRPPGRTRSAERAEQWFRNLSAEVVARAEEAEARRFRVRHRALPDAESLWRTWGTVRDEVARLVAGAAP